MIFLSSIFMALVFCCGCTIPLSMAVKKKTVRRSLDLAGNAEGTITKYWAFARGGAWRNPKPTGGPYVCEQCRLEACGENDRTLTMQAVTTIELAPADVCANCGARLLEKLEDAAAAFAQKLLLPGRLPSPAHTDTRAQGQVLRFETVADGP